MGSTDLALSMSSESITYFKARIGNGGKSFQTWGAVRSQPMVVSLSWEAYCVKVGCITLKLSCLDVNPGKSRKSTLSFLEQEQLRASSMDSTIPVTGDQHVSVA